MIRELKQEQLQKSEAKVRARAFIVSALLIPLNAYWVGWMEAVKWTGHPTTYSLYFNTVLLLLALHCVNNLCKKAFGRYLFTRAELIIIYFSLGVGSALVGHDQSQVLLAVIGHVHYFKAPTNRYEELIMPNLPNWLVVTDIAALRDMYIGGSTVWTRQNFLAWLSPLLWWWSFWFSMLMMFMGLCILMIPQWVQREKLSFPLAQFSLYITERGLYKNNLFWLGFIIPTFVNTLNNLHVMFPSVPEMHTHKINLGAFITSAPWNALGWTPINFFPFAIGIGFLLPIDLLFSSWFFYLVWKMQRVVVASLGYPTGGIGNPPYPHEQSFGAYVGLGLLTLWTAKRYLIETLKSSDRRDYIVSPKLSFALVVLGYAFLVWFSIRAGMQTQYAIVFFISYALVSLTVSRLRGEFGAPVHDLHFANPGAVMVQMFGTKPFTPKTLTVFTLYYWFTRAQRSHPMPTAMEGLVIGEQLGVGKAMWLALWMAIILGIPSACYALLIPYYRLGAASSKVGGAQRGFGWEAYNWYLIPWLSVERKPNYGAMCFVFGGCAFVWLLHFFRYYFINFPFHPVGYAVSGTWSMEMVWFPLFIAWMCKAAVIRYGSSVTYYMVRNFFIGLVVGDFVTGGLWNLYGAAFDKEVYRFNE
jgi:hypothetical protein